MAESLAKRAKRIGRYIVRMYVPIAVIVAFPMGLIRWYGTREAWILAMVAIYLPMAALAGIHYLMLLTKVSSLLGDAPQSLASEDVLRAGYRRSTGSDILAGFAAAWRIGRFVLAFLLVLPLLRAVGGGWLEAKIMALVLGGAAAVIAGVIAVYVVTSALLNRLLGDEADLDPGLAEPTAADDLFTEIPLDRRTWRP